MAAFLHDRANVRAETAPTGVGVGGSDALSGSVGALAPHGFNSRTEGVGTAATSRASSSFAALMARWFPLALAVGSWFVGLALSESLIDRATILWALLPTVLLLVLRLGVERISHRIRPGSSPVLAGFAVHTVLVLAAVWLNPFACIYAFVGYFDAERFFRGRQLWVVVGVTAILCSFGQAGGAEGLVRAPVLFACLVVVNLLIALSMMHLSLERERQVLARERATADLQEALSQNATLHEELIEQARTSGVAEERARLSREIHDTVAQGLVGVIRQLEALPGELDGATRSRVERAEEAARGCLTEARRAVRALAPYQLDGTDPVEAIATLAADWARTNRVVIIVDADDVQAPLRHGPVLLRVVQEGLSNVSRHAAAGTVRLTLRADGAAESVRIGDDGLGFDPQLAQGHGLPGMADRLGAVAGALSIDTAPGAGCTLTATVPR